MKGNIKESLANAGASSSVRSEDLEEPSALDARMALAAAFVYHKKRIERLHKMQRITGVPMPEMAESLEALVEIGKSLTKIELGKRVQLSRPPK